MVSMAVSAGSRPDLNKRVVHTRHTTRHTKYLRIAIVSHGLPSAAPAHSPPRYHTAPTPIPTPYIPTGAAQPQVGHEEKASSGSRLQCHLIISSHFTHMSNTQNYCPHAKKELKHTTNLHSKKELKSSSAFGVTIGRIILLRSILLTVLGRD